MSVWYKLTVLVRACVIHKLIIGRILYAARINELVYITL